MNTSVLGSRIAHAQHAGLLVALRTTARDFVAGLLTVTKANLLDQQASRPRLRRF